MRWDLCSGSLFFLIHNDSIDCCDDEWNHKYKTTDNKSEVWRRFSVYFLLPPLETKIRWTCKYFQRRMYARNIFWKDAMTSNSVSSKSSGLYVGYYHGGIQQPPRRECSKGVGVRKGPRVEQRMESCETMICGWRHTSRIISQSWFETICWRLFGLVWIQIYLPETQIHKFLSPNTHANLSSFPICA